MQYQRAQLKMAAKQALKQSRSGPRLTTFLYMVVLGVSTFVLNIVVRFATGMNAWNDLLGKAMTWIDDLEELLEYFYWAAGPRLLVSLLVYSLVSGILTFLLTSLMNAGYNNYCLSVVRRQEPPMSAIFSGFSRAGGVITAKLLVWVFTALWTLLFVAALMIVMVVLALLTALTESEAMLVFMVLVMIAAYIGVYIGVIWVTFRYALVDFLVMDQGLSGMEAVRESKRLMQGNVGRLFVLHLSFIGWYLLQFFLILIGVGAVYGVGIAAVLQMYTSGTVDTGIFAGALIAAVLVMLAAVVGVVILNIWLTPYVTGSVALFYDWTRGAAPAGPAAGPQNWSSGAQNFEYTWSDGPGGSGVGSGPQSGGPDAGSGWGSGGWGQGGSASDGSSDPKEPRSDPWE